MKCVELGEVSAQIVRAELFFSLRYEEMNVTGLTLLAERRSGVLIFEAL